LTVEHPVVVFLRLHATFTRGVSQILGQYDSPLVKQEAEALEVYYTQRITQLTQGLAEQKQVETVPEKKRKIYKNGKWQEI